MSVFPLKRPSMVLNKRKKVIIAGGYEHTVGLRSDGTVVSVGETVNGQRNVSSWENIVAVACSQYSTAGLKSDGTVILTGDVHNGSPDISGWSNIVAIDCSSGNIAGLKSDGTVVIAGSNVYGQCNVSDWKNIVAVSCGTYHTVGLKSDGTVIAVGNNDNGECNVSSWSDIVAVACGQWYTVGLKSDGTVVATGSNNNGRCNVSGWSNIIAVASIDAHTVGLKSDGTVVATGYNVYGQCNVSDWKNIVAVASGFYHTVGLRPDGTCVAVGNNDRGQCNITWWKLATYDKKGLLIAKTPINLLDKTKVKGFTFEGIQPTNTNRRVAFKVDDKWNKLTADGALSELSTQAITSDSVLTEGNTTAELTALTNVPSLAGKLVYPAIALYASEKAEVMPTFGMTVKAEIDTTVDVYTKTDYSQEFVLHNKHDVLVKSVTVDSNAKGNGKVTLKARYATFVSAGRKTPLSVGRN